MSQVLTMLSRWVPTSALCIAVGLAMVSGVSAVQAQGVVAAQFAKQNPEFARLVQDVDGVYKSTQDFQDFFLACGGVGTPTFSCGLASDFYDQLADRFDLPKQEVEDPAKFRDPAVAARDKLQAFINNLKLSKKVCVSVNVVFKKIKKCVTVSYPGSLNHFLDKVPDFPGIDKLKDKVRDAFDELKKKYDSLRRGVEAQITNLDDLIGRLDKVQQAIDAEDRKVREKAEKLAAKVLQEAIGPALDPLLEDVAKVSAAYVAKLEQTYLRQELEKVLALARSGWKSTDFSTAYGALHQQVSQETKAGADPLGVMSVDVPAVIYHLMATCVDRPDAEAAKSCTQEQFAAEMLSLSEDLVQSIYTHTSQRLLYAPCSAQLADDVTTEAAADTYGISCTAYKTLQQTIEQLMEQTGNDIYENTVAPFVKSVVEDQLHPGAVATAKEVVESIPLTAFRFPGQNNAPVKVTTCDRNDYRFLLPDNTCIVPLENLYIYTWADAANTCALKFGAPLCTKDQVAEGQQQGYTHCAYSWTATPAGPGEAYQVTPMAYNAQGCPPKGLNAAVYPVSQQFSGLCCVPFAK